MNPQTIFQSALAIGLLAFPSFANSAEKNLLDPSAMRIEQSSGQPSGSFTAQGDGSWKLVPPPPVPGASKELRVIFPIAGSDLPAGEGLIFECEARAVAQEGDTAAGQAGLLLEAASARGDAAKPTVFFRHIFLTGPDWERFQIPIEASESAPAGAWVLALVPDHFNQPIELRDMRLRRLQPGEAVVPAVSYKGQEADAPWRKQAAERIARHRMGDFSVLVTDRFGKPIPGASMKLEQLRHEYIFGSCVVASRLVDAEISFKDPAMTREQFLADNARYREEFLRLFNFAVFENDLKWPMWDASKPNFRQSNTLQALEWLKAHNIAIKGHTLIWASWKQSPAWLKELENDKPALQAAILRHIRDVGDATAPYTTWWDVLNEPMSHRDILELLGQDAVAEWFRTAREVLPGQTLVLNDFDLVGNGGNAKRREGVVSLIKSLQAANAAPDVLGFQSHFWSNRLTPPETIWNILDEMHAATGLRLAATEFDINFPNDRVQADYTRDFLTAWFAHPATNSFIMWGFWGGAHWFGERGAMFRRDWTPKPNLQAYTDLVFKEWWTNATGTTDSRGEWSTRAFKGDFRLRVAAPGCHPVERTVRISDRPTKLSIVLHPL
jgi:GH35 family endo-1,4-beta-xylanase